MIALAQEEPRLFLSSDRAAVDFVFTLFLDRPGHFVSDAAALREAGDREAQMLNEDYLEAMEYGMPPAAGFGLSERLFSVLSDKSIRETTIFPLMKSEK